jgi:7-cyano-7-deazaguanine synthase
MKPKSKISSAICLISGGLDSATVLGILLEQGYKVYPRTFDYGQLHKREIQSAKNIVSYYKDKYPGHLLPVGVVELGVLKTIGGSALTNHNITVPTQRDNSEMSSHIPVTYVPGRNTILLSIALSIAETVDADLVGIGVNHLDYSGYPDCRPEYIEAFNNLARLSSKRAVEGHPIRIYAPLLKLTKSEIIKRGTEIGVPYHLTWSCYQGGGKPCGVCDSCILRAQGFKEAGLEDPAIRP